MAILKHNAAYSLIVLFRIFEVDLDRAFKCILLANQFQLVPVLLRQLALYLRINFPFYSNIETKFLLLL